MPAPTQHNHRLRDRTMIPQLGNGSLGSAQRKQGPGVLPTPDPTIASCISDEDVALQLMRLGDASNISHGRTSASTLDDTLSGRADVASSVGSDSGGYSEEDEQNLESLPHAQSELPNESYPKSGASKRHYRQLNEGLPGANINKHSGDEVDGDYLYNDKRDGVFKSDPDDLNNEYRSTSMATRPGQRSTTSNPHKARSGISGKKGSKVNKRTSSAMKTKSSTFPNTPRAPISPASLAPQSRKTSASTLNFQHQLGMDEEDLSSSHAASVAGRARKGVIANGLASVVKTQASVSRVASAKMRVTVEKAALDVTWVSQSRKTHPDSCKQTTPRSLGPF